MSEMIDHVLDIMLSRGLMADDSDARALVAAMRIPTKAMLDAAWRLPDDGPAIIYKSAIEEKWREMIEAALKDD